MYTTILRSLSATFCICFLAMAVNAQQNPATNKPTASSQNISGVKASAINQGAQTSAVKTASSLSDKEAGDKVKVQNAGQNALGKNPAVAQLPSNQPVRGNPAQQQNSGKEQSTPAALPTQAGSPKKQ